LVRLSAILVGASLSIASGVAATELPTERQLSGVETAEEHAVPADPLTTRLQAEVLRYYRGIGSEPTEAELESGLSGASELLLADVSLVELSAAIDRAIEAHPTGGSTLFQIVVPTYVRSTLDDARESDGEGEEDRRAQKVGTGLMIAAFVAQGVSFGATISTAVDAPALNQNGPVLWIVQAGSIPFAPLGVTGFALRFGGESRSERLRWTGIGLLQAAGYSGLVGGFSFAAAFSPGMGEEGILLVPGLFGHLGATIAFAVSGGVCVGLARSRAARRWRSDSGRAPNLSARRGFVVPTIAPRDGGLSLGLSGVF